MNLEIGQQIITICILANISRRKGIKILSFNKI